MTRVIAARSAKVATYLPIAFVALFPIAAASQEEPDHARRRSEELKSRSLSDSESRLTTAREVYEMRRTLARTIVDAAAPEAWQSLGPIDGAGRVNAIAVDPIDSRTIYAGAAGGGVWKSSDGGATWSAITDDIPDLAVGALAVAPSDRQTIYIGSGDPYGSGNGIGLLVSTDGGRTWQFPVSVISRTFSAISVHPTRPRELVAACDFVGLLFSADGGATWTIDKRMQLPLSLARDPSNPNILLAGGRPTGTSDTTRVLKSTDGGRTWAPRTAGISVSGSAGPMAIAIAPSVPSTIYGAIADDQVSHVFKSTDGGETWADLPGLSGSTNSFLHGYLSQPDYSNAIVISPTDPNVVIVGGLTYPRTTDGGVTWAVGGSGIHVDAHALVYAGSTLYFGTDGGVWASNDDGKTATSRTDGMVTRQYYGLDIDPTNHAHIVAGAQDNGLNVRPASGGLRWAGVDQTGGDGIATAFFRYAPSIIFGTLQGGLISRSPYDTLLTASRGISPPYGPSESRPFVTRLLFHPPATLYTPSSTKLWRSDDAGDSWTAAPLPATFPLSLAVAPSDVNVLMVGDTNIFRSEDGGRSWFMPSKLNKIFDALAFDPADARIIYAATWPAPNMYKSLNGGIDWTPLPLTLPNDNAEPSSLAVNPSNTDVVYCGTDIGLYVSSDRGQSWHYSAGLPASRVTGIRFVDDGSAVLVSTYGRGIWELALHAPAAAPTITVTPEGGRTIIQRGDSLQFAANVSDPSGAAALRTPVWAFTDDWTSASGAAATHRFLMSGSYLVSCFAANRSGAEAASGIVIDVRDRADACSTPAVFPSTISPVAIRVSIANATVEKTDPASRCGAPLSSLWFEFTPPESGTYEIVTASSSVHTEGISVWTGAACGPYVATAANANCNLVNEVQPLRFTATQATTVRIKVETWSARLPDKFSPPISVSLRSLTSSAPIVTAVSPLSLNAGKPTAINITGTGFTADSKVFVAGIAATSVTLTASTMLSAVVAPQIGGFADVSVANADGARGTLVNGLVLTPPGRRPAVRH